MGQSSKKLIKVYGPPQKPSLFMNPLAWVAAVLLAVIAGLLVFGDRETPLAPEEDYAEEGPIATGGNAAGATKTPPAQQDGETGDRSTGSETVPAEALSDTAATDNKVEPKEVPAVADAAITNGEGDEARRYIHSVRSHGDAQDLGSVYRRAGELAAAGKQTDAYLLYFFAAREGHAASAFVLAGLSDPNHYRPGANLATEPDPLQSLKWYRVAASDGYAEAQTRLRDLQAWVEQRAKAGDVRAQQLLLSFR